MALKLTVTLLPHPRTCLGLLGHPLSHSFSPSYWAGRFAANPGLAGYSYELFDRGDLADFDFKAEPNLLGFNVTVPYKQAIIPWLDTLTPEAETIGAVNTVVHTAGGWVGHNTDAAGFTRALLAWHVAPLPSKALVLGTGGSARAVVYALAKLGVEAMCVSRTARPKQLTYPQLNADVLAQYTLVVNATPAGMHPHPDAMPAIEAAWLTPRHAVFDLIYNPAQTRLLAAANAQGACTLNGLPMLIAQAEAAGDVWFGHNWQKAG